jgi:hypothetical protein
MMYLNIYMLLSRVIWAIAAYIVMDMDKMMFVAFAWLDCNWQLFIETSCCSGKDKQT